MNNVIYIDPKGTPHLVRDGHIRELHLVSQWDLNRGIRTELAPMTPNDVGAVDEPRRTQAIKPRRRA